MDPQHRHELEQNDLFDFFLHFRQWWEKYGTGVLVFVLAIALLFFGKRFLTARSHAAHETAWGELATATSPQAYESVAKNNDDPVVQALANLRGADLLLAKSGLSVEPMNFATTSPSTQPASESARQLELDQASRMYKLVIDARNVHNIYKLNALLGYAAVAEAQGKWKDAESSLRQALEQSEGFEGIRAQASAQLSMLGKMQEKVIYAAPATQPASAPAATQPHPTPLLPEATH